MERKKSSDFPDGCRNKKWYARAHSVRAHLQNFQSQWIYHAHALSYVAKSSLSQLDMEEPSGMKNTFYHVTSRSMTSDHWRVNSSVQQQMTWSCTDCSWSSMASRDGTVFFARYLVVVSRDTHTHIRRKFLHNPKLPSPLSPSSFHCSLCRQLCPLPNLRRGRAGLSPGQNWNLPQWNLGRNLWRRLVNGGCNSGVPGDGVLSSSSRNQSRGVYSDWW